MLDNHQVINEIVLIEATHQDIPQLIHLEYDAVHEKTYSAMTTHEDWQEEFRTSKVFFIKYKQDIVGNLSYEIREPDEIYLSGILILESFRGLGIAKRVLTDLLRNYPNYNFTLVTHPLNTALFLYQNLGFVMLERMENYFGDGEPRVRLYLKQK